MNDLKYKNGKEKEREREISVFCCERAHESFSRLPRPLAVPKRSLLSPFSAQSVLPSSCDGVFDTVPKPENRIRKRSTRYEEENRTAGDRSVPLWLILILSGVVEGSEGQSDGASSNV